jgi:ferredoxin
MARGMTKNRGASKVFFWIPGRKKPETVVFDGRPSVLELAISQQIPLETSCGGMGTCTACRVFVKSDLTKMPERTEVEAEMARDRDFEPRERLGCQLVAYDGLEVEIPGKGQKK